MKTPITDAAAEKNMRIVVVDDDDVTGRMLGRMLVAEGHVVAVFASGLVALDELRARVYDALLTDLIMPGMGGLELIAQARGLYPALRCLVLSGHAPQTHDLPDVRWVQKPIDFDEVLAHLA